ncbi:TatD family hydrolase [Sulfuracidifex tepidarius]|uniref:Tat-linked quality control protein TatD n=1 Tax=Sulfuracidifex tepidarius TaxID=1294262 RepID=A0A510DWT8_9CREN|nr:TatD family hydrolase [Sulfuracidifex tepidarius]BBG24655.1 Tat-linked quality control protein TatD [Sulfuracidifex tepidarius]BBG27443.1 Tat-linked quality control protein TatD [Sulfuracidifex tepidarius]
MLIDVHSHIDSEEFNSDRDSILKKCNIIVVDAGINYENNLKVLEIVAKYSNVIPAIGLHPENINYDDPEGEIDRVTSLASKAEIISEIGLDYYWIKDEEKRKVQREILGILLSIAEKENKPVVVHVRGGLKDFLEIIASFKVRFDIHAYEGSVKNAMKIVEMGGYISFPPVIVRDKQRQNVALNVPKERVLTETDSPFLGPTRDRNEPCNVKVTLEALSTLWRVDTKEIEEIIFQNFRRFLNKSY